jgi:hypothetical protein
MARRWGSRNKLQDRSALKSLRNVLAPAAAVPSGRSLRRRLISSILLAVLGGYGALLLAHDQISRLQRAQAHDQLVTKVLEALSRNPSATFPVLGGVQGPLGWTGVSLQPLSASTRPTPPRLRVQGERRLLESVLAFSGPNGQERRLRVQQDVTEAIASQHLIQILLLLGAGLSTLLTGALLRPILVRGLEAPISHLSHGSPRSCRSDAVVAAVERIAGSRRWAAA